jgi:histidinol-phosphatase (PHP family)
MHPIRYGEERPVSWPGFDYHTHVCIAPLDEMVAAAQAKGVRELGISEHIFMLEEGQPIFPLQEEDGVRQSRAAYVEAVRERAHSAELDLRLGLEVDFEPGTEWRVRELLDGVEWDYLIGSIHVIAEHDIFLHSPSDAAHADRLWRDYYRLFVDAVESGMFDVISHPVRQAISNEWIPADIDDLLSEVAIVAARNEVALELNGNDTESWPQLVERLARACGRAGCPVSLGSDAHRPSAVARSLQHATEIAIAAGVPGIVSFKGRDRRVIQLG